MAHDGRSHAIEQTLADLLRREYDAEMMRAAVAISDNGNRPDAVRLVSNANGLKRLAMMLRLPRPHVG